jgi:hypothetical protein
MFNPAAIPPIADAVRQWFTTLRAESILNDERQAKQHREALDALLTALNETQIYLGASEPEEPLERDEVKEDELARLWTHAAIILQPLSNNLAERCLMKGNYWANPARWTRDDLQQANISIDQMMGEVRQILRGLPAK